MSATPLYVIKSLAEVRESGLTNMFDRDSVEMLIRDQRAAEWIEKASNKEYMAALQDMGRAESDDWMGADSIEKSTDEYYGGDPDPDDDEEHLDTYHDADDEDDEDSDLYVGRDR